MKTMKREKELFIRTPEDNKTHSRIRLWVLAALLLAAGVLLFRPLWARSSGSKGGESFITAAPTNTPAPTLPPESLTARQTREAAYEKDLATLKALSQDEGIQEATRQQAARQMNLMIQQHQMELGVEEALTNAGFAPCLVLMQNDALTVAVSASEVTAAQSAVILSICLAHTEVAAENIRIMPSGIQD